ncbi:MAG: hypothetical protein PVJ53_10640 [Desulfobacterales bacterium]|jgi:hypothetical protein
MPLLRGIVLMALAVPVFTGVSPLPGEGEILPGVLWAPVGSLFLVMGGVGFCCGRAFLGNTMALTALILIPIVFVGGLVSYLSALWNGVGPGAAGFIQGAHYVMLALNMLNVIPLALAIVASIPFEGLAQKLLRRTAGISTAEKYLLMFVRVFSHIVYTVIPNILEIVREEALLQSISGQGAPGTGRRRIASWVRRLTAGMVQVAVSGICASLRFIPLWAREIDDLPSRTPHKHRSPT